MTKDELLNIFKIKDLYEKYKKDKKFLIMYENRLAGKTTVVNYFFDLNKIIITVLSDDFSKNGEDKKTYIPLDFVSNELVLNKVDLENENFPFLFLKDNLIVDLNFISGIINNILIPKHDLHYSIIYL